MSGFYTLFYKEILRFWRVALLESGGRVRHERCYPVRLSLAAELAGAACAWALEMSGPGCAWQDSGEAPDLASWVREARTLPLIACYPAERHWRLPQVSADSAMRQQESRLHGYQDWRDAAADTRGLESWVIGKTLERLEAVAMGEPTAAADELERVNQVIRLAMPGARGLRFDVKYRQLMLDWTQAACAPFDTLSDGQRGMVALLADIARRMCLLNPQLGDAVLSDTPGIKGFGLIDIDDAELWHYFPEMMRTAPDCRFYNCTHTHEPGCAVVEAVERGQIAYPRYESYLKILDEDEKYRK